MAPVTLFSRLSFALLSCALSGISLAKPDEALQPRQSADPCTAIAGQSYVVPSKLAACLNSFPFNATLRDNIVEVVSKSLNFHTSVNYQLKAPPPFTDVHVDIQAELARMKNSEYTSDYAFHQDISLQVHLLFDGHCTYLNYCYDSLYVTYLPFPLVNLNSGPEQAVYIAPEAYDVVSREFADFVDKWQTLAGYNFSSYSGAKVLAIDGQDPWVSVENNANVVGNWQGRSSRENNYFSSYTRGVVGDTWSYRMGDFAARSLPPTKDSVNITVIPFNSTTAETIVVPFISRNATELFTDGPDLWAKNCVPVSDTNGINYWPDNTNTIGQSNDFTVASIENVENPNGNDPSQGAGEPGSADGLILPVLVDPSPRKFAAPISPEDRGRSLSSAIDATAFANVLLPPRLNPPTPVSGNGTAYFYMQGKVGVLALGSFSTGSTYNNWFTILNNGFTALKDAGATHLIVDVTNNGGGFICVAAWLHRFLAGPKNTTEPNAGFSTKARWNTLTRNITQWVVEGNAVERAFMLYDPVGWKFANSTTEFPQDYNWMEDPVLTEVNGRQDAFSQRLGDECTPYPVALPNEPFLPIENIGIVNNGRCASSCSIFTITMSKKENAKMAVVGGRNTTEQQYSGTVGGQSIDFATIQSEIKTAHMESDPLFPPDFKTNSFQGLTWRLGYDVLSLPLDPLQPPEEWMDHKATENAPLTLETVNNPVAIWKSLAARWWPDAEI